VKALQGLSIAFNGAGLALLSVSVFPKIFGVIVEDGSPLFLLGILVIAVGGLAEFLAQKREEGTHNA